MASVLTLISASQVAPEALAAQTQQRLLLWENWLQPVTAEQPTGDDPGYDDDFQLMREEVNKLSGANTDLICQLAEKLLTTVTQISASPHTTPGPACTAMAKRVWLMGWNYWLD